MGPPAAKENYFFDMYTSVKQGSVRKTLGITDGLCAQDEDPLSKRNREAGFPADLLSKGMEFQSSKGQASEPLDKDRILGFIGDESTLLDNALHGVVAVSSLSQALEERGDRLVQAVNALQTGRVRKLMLDLNQSEARGEDVLMVLEALGPELKILQITNCEALNQIPESMGTELSALKCMVFRGWSQLKNLPDSLGNLKQLTLLDLQGCKELEKLPESIVQLPILSQLILQGCSKLKTLPNDIGQLTLLDSLDLSWCKRLEGIPDSVGDMSSLASIYLDNCEDLRMDPEAECFTGAKLSMLSLRNLRISVWPKLGTALCELDLSGCVSLKELPNDAFSSDLPLQKLRLGPEPERGSAATSDMWSRAHSSDSDWAQVAKYGTGVATLPESIGNLSSLTYLSCAACIQLATLPDSIINLSRLGVLNLNACKSLTQLPDQMGDLPQLKALILQNSGVDKSNLPESITARQAGHYFGNDPYTREGEERLNIVYKGDQPAARSAGCFNPEAAVVMGDGTTKLAKDVILGDILATPDGTTRVQGTLVQARARGARSLIKIGTLIISSMHRIMHNGVWIEPAFYPGAKTIHSNTALHNFVVEGQCSIFVNGIVASTIGQYCKGSHDFQWPTHALWGSSKIVQILEQHPSWPAIQLGPNDNFLSTLKEQNFAIEYLQCLPVGQNACWKLLEKHGWLMVEG